MLQGHRTWVFENKPVIISTGVVGGPFEAKGKFQKTSIPSMKIYGSGKIPMKKHIKFCSKKLVAALLKSKTS